MSFEELASGIHDVVKDTFGEEVAFTPLAGGASTSLKGIFNTRYQVVDPNGEQVVSSNQPTLGVKLADLPAPPVKGDFLLIREKQYQIHDSQEDGEGWLYLFLHEV